MPFFSLKIVFHFPEDSDLLKFIWDQNQKPTLFTEIKVWKECIYCFN